MRAHVEKVPSMPDRSFHYAERRLARFDAPWHFHPEIELTLVVESCGRRFVGDNIERFAEGDLVLLGPNLPHFWCNEGPPVRGRRAHSVVVQFLPDFLGGELWMRPEFGSVSRLFLQARRGLQFTGAAAREAATRLCELGGRHGCDAVLELLAILDLLAKAGQARPLASPAYEPSLDRHSEERLARVYAHLMANYREALTLADIARVAAMTPAAFSRYFKHATGRNVSDFINDLRIDDAARLLRDTSDTIAAVAVTSGFTTLSNFNRRFRERLRCAPREYRRVFAAVNFDPVPSRFAPG